MGRRSKRLRAQLYQYAQDEAGSYDQITQCAGYNPPPTTTTTTTTNNHHSHSCYRVKFSRTKCLLLILLVTVCAVVAIGVSIGIFPAFENILNRLPINCTRYSDPKEHSSPLTHIHNDVTELLEDTCKFMVESALVEYNNVAVTTDGAPCAKIAVNILKLTSNVADATVSALFCNGIINSQSMGLGGGFLLTYYQHSTRRVYTLDAREVAPAAATENMFIDGASSSEGGLAVGVPGQLRGQYELFMKFGSNNLTIWAEIIEPSIRLCEDGHVVNWHLAFALIYNEMEIYNEPSLSIFINPETGKVYKEGEILRRPKLAATLRVIQLHPDALYSGELSDKLIEDLKSFESIITKQDLLDYHPKWRDNMNVTLMDGKVTMYSMPPPGSGHLLGFILNVLDNYKFNPDSLSEDNKVITYQRITEALKYTYAKRTELGDMDFVDIVEFLENLTSEDYATRIFSNLTDNETFQHPGHYGAVNYQPDNNGGSHLSVLGPNGDAVSVTSSINQLFGAKIRSMQTGIILNDVMDDFSAPNITNLFDVPPSPNNFIKPGKRPMSSMCPSIFINNTSGDVRLIIGASGGTQIISGLSLVSVNYLQFGMDIKQAIDTKRIHHQLLPMTLFNEEEFDQIVVGGLNKIGHSMEEFGVGGSVVNGIAREDQRKIFANSDFRKSGGVEGY